MERNRKLYKRLQAYCREISVRKLPTHPYTTARHEIILGIRLKGVKMIHWAQVQFEDNLELEQRIELLREYRDTGSITDYFLTPIEGQSTEPEDAWEAGAKPDEIDWTGFPEAES